MGEVLHSSNTIPIADLYSGTGGRYKTGARGGGHEGVDTSMTNTYRGWLSIQCLLTCTKYAVHFSVLVWSTHTHTERGEGESARLRASIRLFGTPPQSCAQFDREPHAFPGLRAITKVREGEPGPRLTLADLSGRSE